MSNKMPQKPSLNPKDATDGRDSRRILATKKQVDYMLILFNDLGYGTRAQIKGWLETHKVRQTLGLGDLTIGEAVRVVDLLKQEKADNEEAGAGDVDWDEMWEPRETD
jgi:hypothetical protein